MRHINLAEVITNFWYIDIAPLNVRHPIQLFRQRLSHKSVKACVTMPIGIMGSKSLALLDRGSSWFNNKEWESMNTHVCAVSFHHVETPWGSITTIINNNFQRCHVSFSSLVRQPYSKQLYVRPPYLSGSVTNAVQEFSIHWSIPAGNFCHKLRLWNLQTAPSLPN